MARSKDSNEENDLTRSGRSETKVETQTIVEDRTDAPEERPMVEYTSEDEEVGPHGTIRTTYGEPVGGFPEQADA